MLFVDRHRKLSMEEQEQSTASLQVSTSAIQGSAQAQLDFPNNSMWPREAVEAMPQAQYQAPSLFVAPVGPPSPIGSPPLSMARPLTDNMPTVNYQLAERQTGDYSNIT